MLRNRTGEHTGMPNFSNFCFLTRPKKMTRVQLLYFGILYSAAKCAKLWIPPKRLKQKTSRQQKKGGIKCMTAQNWSLCIYCWSRDNINVVLISIRRYSKFRKLHDPRPSGSMYCIYGSMLSSYSSCKEFFDMLQVCLKRTSNIFFIQAVHWKRCNFSNTVVMPKEFNVCST